MVSDRWRSILHMILTSIMNPFRWDSLHCIIPEGREKERLQFLIKNYRGEFTPIEVSRELSVTNKTIINRLAVLVKNGFAVPILVNERIRSYELSEFTRDHEKEIMKIIS